MPSLPKKSVRISPETTLSKAERAEALQSARAILETVSTDWTFTPPAQPQPPQSSKSALHRSGSLGSWRPTSSFPPPADDSDSEHSSSSSVGADLDLDLDLDDAGTSTSYRRALTPPPKRSELRRRQQKERKQRAGLWVRRLDDSDAEVLVSESDVESPNDVPTPRALRRRQEEDEMRWNEGLRLWVSRRDAWTGAIGDEVPVGESRFKDNLLTGFVGPQAYEQIYRKVVIEGATPPVPIGLKHMVSALVDGWKRDDMWPPRSEVVVEPVRRKGLRKLMGMGMGMS